MLTNSTPIAGLVDTGFADKEYAAPATPGQSKTEIHYPSFTLTGPSAKELLNVLPEIGTDFAAIVVLNVHSKQGPTDDDADYDDERIELQVKALLPHAEDQQESDELEGVMAGFKEEMGKQATAKKKAAVGAVATPEEEMAEGE
jgi:hypothetical protein